MNEISPEILVSRCGGMCHWFDPMTGQMPEVPWVPTGHGGHELGSWPAMREAILKLGFVDGSGPSWWTWPTSGARQWLHRWGLWRRWEDGIQPIPSMSLSHRSNELRGGEKGPPWTSLAPGSTNLVGIMFKITKGEPDIILRGWSAFELVCVSFAYPRPIWLKASPVDLRLCTALLCVGAAMPYRQFKGEQPAVMLFGWPTTTDPRRCQAVALAAGWSQCG